MVKLKQIDSDVAICFQMFKFAVVMKKEEAMSPQERSIIRKTTFPIGEVFESNGVLVECVLRPYVGVCADACGGCFFRDKTCPKSQCSSFGRTDGKNVWFVEVSKR